MGTLREGMDELYIIKDERDIYRICSDKSRIFVEHTYMASCQNDKQSIIYSNANDEHVVIACNLDLVYPLLYILDKLEAMY